MFIQVENPATDEFEFLAKSSSSGTAIVDPNLPDTFPFTRPNLTIPQRFWAAGVSDGYRARLRIVIGGDEDDPESYEYVLGTADNFNTPELCAALQTNSNYFKGSAPTLEAACLNTPTSDDLTFTFETPDFNDHCGLENEACCTVGKECEDDGVALECKEQTGTSGSSRCRSDKPAPENEPDAGTGGIADDAKCTDGEIEVVEFTPTGCEGFSVTGYRVCKNGKLSEPTAAQCNTGSEAPDGTNCYCRIMGGVCGLGAGSICGQNKGPKANCLPFHMCQPFHTGGPSVEQQWKCAEFFDAPLHPPKCWTPADTVVFNPGGEPTYPPENCTTGDKDCECYSNDTCNGDLFCNNGKCGDFVCPAGTAGCPCFGNDTCNEGLTCDASKCVAPPANP